jgi:hypothetical protein
MLPYIASFNQLEMKMHARADAPAENAQSWPEDIFGVLQRFEVRQVPYVPDAGHSQLIERVLHAPSMHAVPLTTEEEGVWRCWRAPGPAGSAACC